jgi:hypothetical protein
MFEAFDLLRNIGVNGRSQLNIAGTDMNLHVIKLHSGFGDVHSGGWSRSRAAAPAPL